MAVLRLLYCSNAICVSQMVKSIDFSFNGFIVFDLGDFCLHPSVINRFEMNLFLIQWLELLESNAFAIEFIILVRVTHVLHDYSRLLMLIEFV